MLQVTGGGIDEIDIVGEKIEIEQTIKEKQEKN